MGDAVNLASRLEGLCKLYGVEIICSEDTVRMLPTRETFLLRELDLVRVKGKSQPTKLFHVVRQDKDVEAKSLLNVVRMDTTVQKSNDKGSFEKFASMRKKLLRNKSKSQSSKSKSQQLARMVFFVQDEMVDDVYRRDIKAYESSLREFQEGNFEAAMKFINAIERLDTAALYLKRRIEAAADHKKNEMTLQEKWTGINNLLGKDF
mmetsp:Transcript_12824/g.15529  ORF Transcript_12824/g.15529 Transcript_12824/m.15529 type:complete len:206 (-) Transcript_12824:1482-2099(-)